MTERIKLTQDNFDIILNDGDMSEDFLELIKQQILDDQEKVNRLNQIFSNHKKGGSPTNIPELTGVNQGVIDQIQNIIGHLLEYIEQGKVPNGYSKAKGILEVDT